MDRSRSPHLVTTFDVQRGAKPTLIHGDATPRAEVLADGPVKTMSKQSIGFRKALRRRHDGVVSTASSRRLDALRLALTDVVRGIGDRASLLSRERRQMRRGHISRLREPRYIRVRVASRPSSSDCRRRAGAITDAAEVLLPVQGGCSPRQSNQLLSENLQPCHDVATE